MKGTIAISTVDGQSLVQIVEANGSDVDTARTALVGALDGIDLGGLDAEAIADRWLGPLGGS